jgi:histone H3/H4
MSPPAYAQKLIKVAIGQILQTIGFQTAQSSALDLLVNIFERYIMLLGKSAHDYSELGKFTFD